MADNQITAKDLKNYPRMVRWFNPWLLLKLLLQVVVADVFGQYADRRLIHAALDTVSDKELVDRADLVPAPKPDAEGAIWIDYISDLGDGFDATYAMAYLLAQEQLVVDGVAGPLPRGGALVMGGDEVYPTATRENYKERMFEPYKFAYPNRPDGPNTPIYMIPGNHDWYDGLTLFLALFCRKWSTKIGNWHTRQRRSYFALKLAPNWWLWAIDIQLGDDMDQPQADYFAAIAKAMPENASVILCSAEPGWYEAASNGSAFRVLGYAALLAINAVIEKTKKDNPNKNLKIVAALSGDTHHYSRYSCDLGTQFITSGGGGAFLHGTHNLEETIMAERWLGGTKLSLKTEPVEAHIECDKQACYPSKQTSNKLLLGNFLFPFWNWDFSLVLGAIYWLFSFALFARPELDTRIIIGLMLALGFGGYFAYQGQPAPGRAFLYSLPQAFAHFAAMIALAAAFAAIFPDLAPCSWRAFFALLPFAVAFGWLIGGLIFGINLYLTSRFFGLNHNDAFSALRLDSHRHFLRMRIKGDTLTIYPIALDRVPRRDEWQDNPKAKSDKTASRFVPKTPLKPRLIEGPIVIDARKVYRTAKARAEAASATASKRRG